MNTRLFAALFALVIVFVGLHAGPRDAAWEAVDQAVNRGLPKSAIEQLEPIIVGAVADRFYAEAIKAIGRRIALEGVIEGNKPEAKIVRLQAEIAKAPSEMKPVMEAILAHWYWQYYQQNRGRFLQRTQTAAAPGADIQTWDLARILSEIGKHFDAALVDAARLQATPIRDFDALVQKGNVPDAYRPTLFDFLAYEALSFYQAGEQAATVAEDAFEIEAVSPIFGDTADFLSWKPVTRDFASPKLKAIALYQSLLRYHANDTDRSAFLDADLARLTYGKNVAVGEEKDARYKAALERFAATTNHPEVRNRVWAALAAQLKSEGDFAVAHQIAQRGLDTQPHSAGGALCFNLLQEIEQPSVSLATERVWNAPWPTLDVTYRNLRKVYFRAVSVDFEHHVARSRWGLASTGYDRFAGLLAESPALEWSAELPLTSDFKERTEHVPAPTTLKPGFYAILASHDPAFGEENNQISSTMIWVSDLALVLDVATGEREVGGFVLRAESGEPVSGAIVRRWERGNNGDFVPLPAVVADQDGRFAFVADRHAVLVMAEAGGHAVSNTGEMHAVGPEQKRAGSHTVFFTDRALYRPGQTINYKGIAIRYTNWKGRYAAIADRRVAVSLRDPSGKEIARAFHRTNDYGSFSGTFTAPRDGLRGRMTLVVDGKPYGVTSFNVEEYKRPKFQVTIESPEVAAKLDSTVVVSGKATAYTGAAIGGAKVQWRVERGLQLPLWCWWWQPPAVKAIAHGTAVTADDGTFKIEFVAEPDRAVPAKNEPTFNYTVHADVTDTVGETRSEACTVRAGYAALAATLSVAEWQTPAAPVELTVATHSLDGVPQTAEGTLTIHALVQPPAVVRAPLQLERRWWWGADDPKPDPTNPDSWALGEAVRTQAFHADATGFAKIAVPLPAGLYRASLETQDLFGKKVTARATIEVADPLAKRYRVKVPNRLSAPQWSIEPGAVFVALWRTGYASGRAFVELKCNGKSLRSYWTSADCTQARIEQPVTESMRGGFTLRVTYVRENRAYFDERVVQVPWSNKRLSVKWERFRSKLLPGQKEQWTAVIAGADAKRVSAEMVATLYDASLGQYQPHGWLSGFGVFREERLQSSKSFANAQSHFLHSRGRWWVDSRPLGWRYRSFTLGIIGSLWGCLVGGPAVADEDVVVLSPFEVTSSSDTGYLARDTLAGTRVRTRLKEVASAVSVVTQEFLQDIGETDADSLLFYTTNTEVAGAAGNFATANKAGTRPDLSKIAVRKNFNETAFFFPHLTAGADGVVRMTFTMPEALTEWKFMGFAHDAQLRSGFITGTAVTAKDLMVQPNPPRFVREGDAIEFTVKVSNQSDQAQQGTVKLTFADAATLASADSELGNATTEQAFDVPAKQSRSYSWRIAVPDGLGFLTYKAVAATAQFSDGEEGFLPVISRRILVTESLPLPIRGRQTRAFEFTKLLNSGDSDTLRHQSLTVQMTSQPAWYAVMALPYLMEYPYECSEQVFSRLYANALARHIAKSDPKIRRVFDLWKNTPALESPLVKNQDLKSVMLEETPWLRQANAESEARRNVGLLFDANCLDDETARALRTLAERQLPSGLWPWFPGGQPSEYISLAIVTGFGRLRHLGVEIDTAPAVKALAGLDAWMAQRHAEILRGSTPDAYVPSHLDAIYLYCRSFFLADQPVRAESKVAIDFYLGQARKHWLRTDCRMCQAQLALALQRFGDRETPLAILASLKERSVSDQEQGMFWRDSEASWWWYRAPIETQATMIEAFAEVGEDAQAVEDCKVWLLKQKQTQDWKTTKATADAIYGLLLRGTNLLSSDALVGVSLGGQAIKPENVEAGTGFYEQKFVRDEIRPEMGAITVKKTDAGVSWGSVHWQYLEDVAKVTPHEGTPLKLQKTLWMKQTTSKGQELVPVNGPVAVGDELVVRIELRTDRDMEFVHLKDQRGSGTEPVDVLSGYRYQDGLSYYASTRDTASHFFIDYLRQGVYVFEYSTRVQLNGSFQTGIAEIQCMYAPEFSSHSESIALEVK